jgi:hypothetical protein
LRGHVPVVDANHASRLSTSLKQHLIAMYWATSAGIEEVLLYITALTHHLQGMSATAQKEEQLSHKSGIWWSAEFNV